MILITAKKRKERETNKTPPFKKIDGVGNAGIRTPPAGYTGGWFSAAYKPT